MASGNPALADAVAKAASDALEGKAADGTPPGEAAAAKTPATPAPLGEVGSEAQTSAIDPARVQAFESAWKLDLSVLPDDESREKFISEFEGSQKTIGQLQREKAEAKREAEEAKLAAEPPADETVVDVSSLTDEQIASAIGINLESSMDPERDQREIALTRTLLEQQERMERMERGYQDSTESQAWDKQLTALEDKFGKLSEDTSREDVRAYAREQGIASAEAAYWAAVGPIRAKAAQALETQLSTLNTSGKKGATTPRPKGSAETDEAKLASTNVRDAVKEAFEKARQGLGIAYVPSE